MNKVVAYIALGSNLENPLHQVQKAIAYLQNTPHIELVTASACYHNPPYGVLDQPEFVNAVVKIRTDLSPEALLENLLKIETEFGRVRERRWGARIIDLDILLYGQLQMQTERLTIPHPELQLRSFVVLPLLEIAPDLRLPKGKLLADLAKQLDHNLVPVS